MNKTSNYREKLKRTTKINSYLKNTVSELSGVNFLLRCYNMIYKPAPFQEFSDYDEFWDKRYQEGREAPPVLARYKFVRDNIPDGASVLDIGCGDGGFLSYLKTQRKNCEVLGIDISRRAIEMLREKGLTGILINPNQPLMKQINRSFDYVVLMEVLEHQVNAESFMRQTLQFNPKSIFISIPNIGFIGFRLRLLLGGRTPTANVTFHLREHVRHWTVKDFYDWTKIMGLEVKQVFGQYGVFKFLVRHYPSLFANGVVYKLEPKHFFENSND